MVTEETLALGIQYLAERDPDLAAIVADLGPPPVWSREPGFPTLIHIILEQQVSLSSARAAFERLQAVASPLTPETFLALDGATLRSVGFSRQKTAYCRDLAQAILEGRLDLDGLHRLDDADARSALLQVRGIGPWTADIYMLMALRRPDICPAGDLALASALQRVKRLARLPNSVEFEMIGRAWSPWRAVAARILWHYYLNSTRSNI